jgi:hypothetical protein
MFVTVFVTCFPSLYFFISPSKLLLLMLLLLLLLLMMLMLLLMFSHRMKQKTEFILFLTKSIVLKCLLHVFFSNTSFVNLILFPPCRINLIDYWFGDRNTVNKSNFRSVLVSRYNNLLNQLKILSVFFSMQY